MKIAVVSEHASPLAAAGAVDTGAQHVYVAQVAGQLARAGHLVDVFTRCEEDRQPLVMRWRRNLRVVHVPAGPRAPVPKEHLLPHMEEFGDWMGRFFTEQTRPYDVVHANFFMSGLASLRARQACPMPLVTTFHALGLARRRDLGEGDGFPEERTEIERTLMRDSTRVVAGCPRDRDDMLELYGADLPRIDVVPCGFDPTEFGPIDRDVARAQLGWPRGAFIALHVGRLWSKGVENAIRSIDQLNRHHAKSAELYIVGGDTEAPDPEAAPDIKRLLRVSAESGVLRHVHFAGRRGREVLRLYYGACDVFVTTPSYEPFGITVVEAMACARPVIGSNVGGLKSTVLHGETGFLVSPNDPGELADRLAELQRDRELGRRMGHAGRERARTFFTWRRVAMGLADSYRRAIGPRPDLHWPARAPAWSSTDAG